MDEAYLIREKPFRAGNYQIKAPKCASNMYGISGGISQFEDISSTIREKAEQQERSNEYSSILNAYNDYTKNIQNFLNQKEQLLVDRMSDEKTSNIGRLSYVNLMNALEQFTKMSTLFISFFSRYIPKEESSVVEDENLLLLGIMWEHVYKVPARFESSVLYFKKQELKKQRKSIHSFIKDEISCLSGVKDVVYSNKQEVYVLLELLNSESFLEEFYQHFSSLFKEFDYATFNYALLASCIKSINVQYCFKAIPTIGGFQIRSIDLLNKSKTDFLEYVKTNVVGFDNYYWTIPDNKIKYILTITGLLASFSIIQKHIEDVYKHLLQLESEDFLIQETVGNWKAKCDSLTKKLFEQIVLTCETLLGFLDNTEQKENVHLFIEVTKSFENIDDLLLGFVIFKEKGENEYSFEAYRDGFTRLIDTLVTD